MNEGHKCNQKINQILHILLKWHVNFQNTLGIITSILENRIEIPAQKLYFTSN
jgi:hypothetical protein